MSSESLSSSEPSSSVLSHAWALSVFRVEDHAAQQRVLRALRRLGHAGISAVGAQRDGEAFVIVDWDPTSDQTRARQVVMAADRHAAMTYTSRP